jgi:polar amino acid transport system substrate-binding protein
MKRRLFTAMSVTCLAAPTFAQAPYRIVYNEATASLVPLMRAVYAELGMTPVFEQLPSERALVEANAGRFDADLMRVEGVEKSYPQLLCTNEPIRRTELYAYVRRGASFSIKAADDLRLHSLGLTRGSKLAEEFLTARGWQATAANSADSLFKMLTVDRFEVALVTSTQLLAHSGLVPDNVERAGPVLSSSHSYHVLHRHNAELAPRIDAVLKAMKADGRLQRYLSTADQGLKP